MTDDQPADRQRQEFVADLSAVMATPSGRHVVGWLLAAGGLFTARFSPDPVVQAHDLGRRDLAQDLFLQLMDVCPGSYVQMITEQKERHERHRVDGDEYAD